MKKLIVITLLALTVSLFGCDTPQPETKEDIVLLQPDIVVEETLGDNYVEVVEETKPIVVETPTPEDDVILTEEVIETETEMSTTETETEASTPVIEESIDVMDIIGRAVDVTKDNYKFTLDMYGEADGNAVSVLLEQSCDDEVVYENMVMDYGSGMVLNMESWYDYTNNVGHTNGLGSWMPVEVAEKSNIPKSLLANVLYPELVAGDSDDSIYTVTCELMETSFGDSYTMATCEAKLVFDKETGYLTKVYYLLDEGVMEATGMSSVEIVSTFSDYNEVSLTIPDFDMEG